MRRGQDSELFRRLVNNKTKPDFVQKSRKPTITDIVITGRELELLIDQTFAQDLKMLKREYKPFDDLDTKVLIRLIEGFRRLDLEHVGDLELNQAIDLIFDNNIVLSLDVPENSEFYRARTKTFEFNKVRDVFKSAEEIWYPKPKFLKKMGRLNQVGQPMFYGSDDAVTPIHEIRSVNDTQFALMKYKVKSGQTLKLAPIAIHSHDVIARRMKERAGFIWTKKGQTNWKIINQFLSEEFTKIVHPGKEYMYRSTNAILNSFNFPDCDGFIYPSIARAGGYNLAIKPEAADRAVEFTGLSYWMNKYYNQKEVRAKDFYCWKLWSKGIHNDTIIYEPESTCDIKFKGLGNINASETVYLNEFGEFR